MTNAISKAKFVLTLREIGMTNRLLLTACEKHFESLQPYSVDEHLGPHLTFLQEIALQPDSKVLFINPTTTPIPLILVSAVAKRCYALFDSEAALKEMEAFTRTHKIHNITCWFSPRCHEGWPAQAPFDYIFCSHHVQTLTKNLFTQLAKRGKVYAYDPFGPYRERSSTAA